MSNPRLVSDAANRWGVPRGRCLGFRARWANLACIGRKQFRIACAALAALTATPSPAGAQNIALTSDKSGYHVGDRPVFTVTAREDCFLTLVTIDAAGRGAVLFPNRFQRDNRIKANVASEIPGPDSAFAYRLHKTGNERIIAVCPRSLVNIAGIAHDFSRNAVTPVELGSFHKWASDNKNDVATLSFKVLPPPPVKSE
jgi:hypothetical protein